MITLQNLELIHYPTNTGTVSRVWIGQVEICTVYHRSGKNDLFNIVPPSYDFHISQYEKKQTPPDWLQCTKYEDHIFIASSLEEGMSWLIKKLNTK